MNTEKRRFIFSRRQQAVILILGLALALAVALFACQGSPETPAPLATPTAKSASAAKTMTAEALTRTAMRSQTPPPTVVGDLGWGEINGTVSDAVTGAPIAGARVGCSHSSYTTPASALCNRWTTTGQDGKFVFKDVFFHDTDWIKLDVEAPGYGSQEYRQEGILTRPYLEAAVYLPPLNVTPIIQCTPPLCAIGTSEVYFCSGDCPGGCGTTCATYTPPANCPPPSCGPYDAVICPGGDCPGGCGLVCITPQAVCTPPLCAIGTHEVYYCEAACPGGCGTTCATYTPAP